MAAVELPKNSTFQEDIQLLTASLEAENKLGFYNEDSRRVAASVTKILNAITCASYFDNHYASITYNDITAGSTRTNSAYYSEDKMLFMGDELTTEDALHLMLLESDNTMANLLARVFGTKLGKLPSDLFRESIDNGIRLGTNPVSVDTTKAWLALGNGIAFIDCKNYDYSVVRKPKNTKGQEPSYGFIINRVWGNVVAQEWHSLNERGCVYHRAGNSYGWYGEDDDAKAGLWYQSLDTTTSVKVANGGTGLTSVAAGNFLVGSDNPDTNTLALVEKTPAEVAQMIGIVPGAEAALKLSRHTVDVSTSIEAFAESCEVGLTYFTTNADTPGLPSANYIYGTGMVMKRSDDFIYVELHSFNTSVYRCLCLSLHRRLPNWFVVLAQRVLYPARCGY